MTFCLLDFAEARPQMCHTFVSYTNTGTDESLQKIVKSCFEYPKKYKFKENQISKIFKIPIFSSYVYR